MKIGRVKKRPSVKEKGAGKVESKMSCCARGMDMNLPNGQQNNDKCNIPKAKCSLAMAYVPFQQWGQIYEPERALDAGTLFPDLDKPFYGKKGSLLIFLPHFPVLIHF